MKISEALALAADHQRAGRLAEAEDVCRRILAVEPDEVDTLCLLAALARAQGRLDQAIAVYRRAAELRPGVPEVLNNLGNALKGRGRTAEAVGCYRQALAARPNFVEAQYNMANALKAAGDLDAAAEAYRRTLELRPNVAEALNNLGNVLAAQGKHGDAVGAFQASLRSRPDHPATLSNLAGSLAALGQLDQAVDCCRRALQIEPQAVEALANLGNILKERGELADAIRCVRQAMELCPHVPALHSSLIYLLHLSPQHDAESIAAEARSWDQRHGRPLADAPRPYANDRSPQRRLRVGYVSADLTGHPIGRYLLPLLESHDREQFEVFCYASVPAADETTGRCRAAADQWRDVFALSDEELAEAVRQDRIDILVDLGAHTAKNRLPAFARKPAPVQVTYLGYPGTTGLSAIDYRLTDPHLDPPGLDDRFYSERSIRLPDSFWCYRPDGTEPDVGPLPAAQRGQVTFGCLNSFAKINAEVLRLWAAVLRAVDRSRLLLLCKEGLHRGRVLEYFAQAGVEPDRVTLAGMRPRGEFLELFREIDLGLDTFPYGGHTTSFDSFWMGVPVVTLVGRTAVGRAGRTLAANLELWELIAETPAQYRQAAVDLAGDLPRLSALRATLRDRMRSSPLTDAPRAAQNLEAAYRGMWRAWCRQ